jgi:hypothetical protein
MHAADNLTTPSCARHAVTSSDAWSLRSMVGRATPCLSPCIRPHLLCLLQQLRMSALPHPASSGAWLIRGRLPHSCSRMRIALLNAGAGLLASCRLIEFQPNLPDREIQSKISGPKGAQMLSYRTAFWLIGGSRGAPFGTPFLAAPETRSTELHAWQVD